MKFGLMTQLQLPRPWTGTSEREAFWNCIDQAVAGEQAGFSNFWITEQHFFEEIGHCPTPEMVLAAISQRYPAFRFVPGLSHLENGEVWDGEQGFIHTVVDQHFKEKGLRAPAMEAYVCGPPPMIDALLPVLSRHGVHEEHIHADKFTQATPAR